VAHGGGHVDVPAGIDEHHLPQPQACGHRFPVARAGHEERLGMAVGTGAGIRPARRDDRDRRHQVGGFSGAGIDDMRAALAVLHEVPLVIAAGADRFIIMQINNGHRARSARVLDADFPRMRSRLPYRQDIAADIDQCRLHPRAAQDPGRPVQRIALRIAAEIEHHGLVGAGDAVAVIAQVGHARIRRDPAPDFGRRRPVRRDIAALESPQPDQAADGRIEQIVRTFGQAGGRLQHVHHFRVGLIDVAAGNAGVERGQRTGLPGVEFVVQPVEFAQYLRTEQVRAGLRLAVNADLDHRAEDMAPGAVNGVIGAAAQHRHEQR